jgi:hypothetical protein
MESRIVIDEVVENKERKFGSDTMYYPCEIEISGILGYSEHALFTRKQIDDAIIRAERNPEDLTEDKTFWERLFG